MADLGGVVHSSSPDSCFGAPAAAVLSLWAVLWWPGWDPVVATAVRYAGVGVVTYAVAVGTPGAWDVATVRHRLGRRRDATPADDRAGASDG